MSGVGGSAIGGVLGGFSSESTYRNNNTLFRKWCKENGISPYDPVPATDAFLKESQKTWYPDAPMDDVIDFSTENIPPEKMAIFNKNKNATAMTPPEMQNGKLTGKSNVYFHPERAFSSAKMLFTSMGHELMHVSQYRVLVSLGFYKTNKDILSIMEYYAYSYQNTLDPVTSLPDLVSSEMKNRYSILINKLPYYLFPWTLTVNPPQI